MFSQQYKTNQVWSKLVSGSLFFLFLGETTKTSVVCAKFLYRILEILYEGGKKGRNNPPFVWCSDRSTASRLADQIYQAKQRYDHSKRTLTVVEDLEQVI